MIASSSEAFLPTRRSLAAMRKAVQACRGCSLFRDATQAVFGAGAAGARIMLVGEQPGDQEDRVGEPFVGPAGRLLDRALGEAGIDRADAYVTNAVKHFKFVRRGERRLHAKPGTTEVVACWAWLREEIRVVAPATIVALGATAARALVGRPVAITRQRGEFVAGMMGRDVLITVHPSYVLRLPDEASRTEEFHRFVADLEKTTARP
jgi:DNA polymerase